MNDRWGSEVAQRFHTTRAVVAHALSAPQALTHAPLMGAALTAAATATAAADAQRGASASPWATRSGRSRGATPSLRGRGSWASDALTDVLAVSLTAGPGDALIRADITSLVGLVQPTHALSLQTMGVPGTWSTTGHEVRQRPQLQRTGTAPLTFVRVGAAGHHVVRSADDSNRSSAVCDAVTYTSLALCRSAGTQRRAVTVPAGPLCLGTYLLTPSAAAIGS